MANTKSEDKQAVAVVEENAGLALVPEFMELGDFGNTGFEGADKDSFAIPFLQLLQKMSPLVDEDNAKYIQGAKAGMLFNTVTQKLYDGKAGLIIIPCAYKRSYIQWAGREAEGGFKGEFTPEQIASMQGSGAIVALDGKLYKPNEDGSVNEKKNDRYEDTRSHFVLVIDPTTGEYGQAIISLSSTQIKASKMLMTALQQKKVDTPQGKKTPPTFANMVKLTTIGMSNDKGAWSGLSFTLDGLVKDVNIYNEAKAFYKAVVDGSVNVDYTKAESPSDAPASGTPENAEGF